MARRPNTERRRRESILAAEGEQYPIIIGDRLRVTHLVDVQQGVAGTQRYGIAQSVSRFKYYQVFDLASDDGTTIRYVTDTPGILIEWVDKPEWSIPRREERLAAPELEKEEAETDASPDDWDWD